MKSFRSRERRPFGSPHRPPSPSAAPSTLHVEKPFPLAAQAANPSATPETLTTFESLGLTAGITHAVVREGYTHPTPIQQQAIPHVLQGRDLVGCAQTGTGKTAAFVLPMLQRLSGSIDRSSPRKIRGLVLAPTRELAIQIAERCEVYGREMPLRHVVIFGGVSQHRQEVALRAPTDIVIATPGRLLDLMQQGILRLNNVEFLVLDEADRMLDMGFVRDVRKICAELPSTRQTLLFSATMPQAVAKLAQSMLRNPAHVACAPVSAAAGTIEQRVVHVAKAEKRLTLERMLRDAAIARAIVFTSTKHGANRLAKQLGDAGLRAEAIHGNKSQGARQRALEAFRTGTSRILVATDVASRGIDVDDVSHVFNYDLPNVPESYVHRIGRTGRAGRSGEAISLCDPSERAFLSDIERLIRQRLSVVNLPEGAVRRASSSNVQKMHAAHAGASHQR